MSAILHSEWTKLRTVRGWVIGLLLLPIVTVGFVYLTASNNQCSDMDHGPGGQLVPVPCSAPAGPGGQLVQDRFYFVHRPLAASGSITARVTALTSTDLQPWAKAGIIIKANAVPGSAYAAMMVTGSQGVRMQWDFTQDTAVSAASARWLRLVRSGDAITGYDSADGSHWTRTGTVTLAGLSSTVQAGVFATSPQPVSGSGHQEAGHPLTATGTFDHVDVTGTTGGGWAGTDVGARPLEAGQSGSQRTDTGFTVTGSGDIAPDTGSVGGGTATPVSQTLDGLFLGLIVAIAVGTIFVTAEYRRGMIRTTLSASPGRGRVLAAKAIVIGAVTFVAGFVGCAISVPVGEHLLRAGGNVVAPVSPLTWLRVVAGTAAVLAAAAVFAVALGAIFRSGAGAVATAIAVIVVPWFLAVSSPALPAAVAEWMLRVSPMAALAIQQTIPRYPQVAAQYLPFNGFFPLAPAAGFAVLCAWTGGALWLAARLLCRRDV